MISTAAARWRVPGIAVVALSLAMSLSAGSASAAPPLVQISHDPYTNPTSNHRTEVEPDTFSFGNTVVSTFQVGRFFDGGATNIGFASSADGGTTWVHGFLPGTTVFVNGPYARVSDPSVAFDPKHGVWLISYLGIKDPAAGPVDVLVSRSADGGRSWGRPVVVNASGDFNDKNWTVCDTTPSSPFYGNCYTEFDDFTTLNLVQMSTSTDGGLTWGAARTTPDRACVIGGQPVVQPNGVVVVVIDDCFVTSLLSFRSTDGGKSWGRTVKAAQVFDDGHPGAIRSLALPTAEVDGSGRVYAVWTDCRFQAACNSGNNDLVMVSSADGLHWTLPKRIPTARLGSGADHLIPGLAVDPSTAGRTARLGLAFYYFPDINCSPSTCRLNVGFVSSTNGGASWSAARQLAGPMTLTWLPLTTQGFMVGDYISTSIVRNNAHAASVFAVARPPTPPPNCSDLSTGAPGSGCHQAMVTAPNVGVVGGNEVGTDVAPAVVSRRGVQLSAPATSF
jgi:hypothetical protein